MTAEEKLRELYEACEPAESDSSVHEGSTSIRVTKRAGSVYIAPEHIDLIANLVVERLITRTAQRERR